MQALEDAPAAVFRADELHTVAFRQRRTVDQVQIGTPMMAAGAGQRGPEQDGADARLLVQRTDIHRFTIRSQHRTDAVEFLVPDGELPFEAAEAAGRDELDAGTPCGTVHLEEAGFDARMQQATRLGQLHDVFGAAARQLFWGHSRRILPVQGHNQANPPFRRFAGPTYDREWDGCTDR